MYAARDEQEWRLPRALSLPSSLSLILSLSHPLSLPSSLSLILSLSHPLSLSLILFPERDPDDNILSRTETANSWMPLRPCLDPSSPPNEHPPSPYSDAGGDSDGVLMYPDSA